jgi:hypothetical protein
VDEKVRKLSPRLFLTFHSSKVSSNGVGHLVYDTMGEGYLYTKKRCRKMQKVVARSLVFLYALAMSNTTTQSQFAIYEGETVMILEQFGTSAWVSFNEGEELEVSMFDLCLI